MKTSLRNKAAAIAFFIIVGLGGGPLLGWWLTQTFDLADGGVLGVGAIWGFLAATVAIFGYHELQEIGAQRRAAADEARLQARWEELRKGLM